MCCAEYPESPSPFAPAPDRAAARAVPVERAEGRAAIASPYATGATPTGSMSAPRRPAAAT